LLVASLLSAGVPTAALAADRPPNGVPSACASESLPRGFNVIAEAEVDECWAGLGQPYPPKNADGTCPSGSIPRRNAGYAWGMTKTADHLWYGTGANVPCLAFVDPTLPPTPGIAAPRTGFLCENSQSYDLSQNPQRRNLADWRRPSVYRIDTCTLEREDLTPVDDPNLQNAIGLRSAGNLNGVVFLAGPGGAANGQFTGNGGGIGDGVVMLAFEESTGRFLGSKLFSEFANIRQWFVHAGVLYTGAQNQPAVGGGVILRWTGNVNDPFQFMTVGEIDTSPANMTFHEGRLYLTSWPDIDPNGIYRRACGVYEGPPIPAGGYTERDRLRWGKVWDCQLDDVDPAVGITNHLGPIRSWRGDLYWGTIRAPALGLEGHRQFNGETWRGPVDLVVHIFATQRSASVYRGVNFGRGVLRPRVEALYNDFVVPAWNGRRFVLRPKRGGLPRFGLGGFNNFWNFYIWQQGEADGQLYQGTFDVRDQLAGVVEAASNIEGERVPSGLLNLIRFAATNPLSTGADLMRYRSPLLPAQPVTFNAGGNPTQFGFRTMVSDGDQLWIGTAGHTPLHPNGGHKVMLFKPVTGTLLPPPGESWLLDFLRRLFRLL
jgi:hypothetical protein